MAQKKTSAYGWKCADCICVGVLQHVRAVLWFLQQPPLHDEAKHLLIGQTLVRLFCQSGNLPQYNPERPAEEVRKVVKSEHNFRKQQRKEM